MGEWVSYPKFVSPATKTLHPDANGTDLDLSGSVSAASGSVAGALYTGGTVTTGASFVGTAASSIIALGDFPAGSGQVRLMNNEWIKGRNAGGTDDVPLVKVDASDNLNLGTGLTGVLKASSSVISAATIVNADVSDTAAIALTKTQPYEFLAYAASVASNVTGDGTQADVAFGTTVKNEGNRFTSPSFSAPVTGTYALKTAVTINDLGAANTTGLLRIVTSNRTFLKFINPANLRDAGNTVTVELAVIADMDADDTAKVTIQVDSGTKIVDISGSTDGRTFFGGFLIG